jgi:hypothetical protein
MTAETTGCYTRALRRELSCFARGRDLALEVETHLNESIARLEADGMAPPLAVATAIERLGPPREIAAAFVNQGEPVAIPTRWTRLTGWVSLLAIPAGIAATAFMIASATAAGDWEGLPQTLYLFGATCLLISGAAIVLGTIGLGRRLGGLGKAGKAGFALVAFSAVATVPGAWFVPAWLVPLAGGLLAIAFSLRVKESPFGKPALIAGAGTTVALLAWLVAAATVGDRAGAAYTAIPMLVPAVAFGMLGIQLAREAPVEVPVAG